MANNYSQFSTMIECSDEEANWLFNRLLEYEEDDEAEYGKVCEYSLESNGKGGVWLRSEESFDAEALGEILCEFQKKFDLEGAIIIAHADYCSKLRLDEFGGGAILIYQGLRYHMGAYNWANEKRREIDETILGFYSVRRERQ